MSADSSTYETYYNVKFVSTSKPFDDMIAEVPGSWNGEKLASFFKTFHKQAAEEDFPKLVFLLLFGKQIREDQQLSVLLENVAGASASDLSQPAG